MLDAVDSGTTRTLVVRGEAGIGKTALAGAVAARAVERGFTVLAGRCSEELQLPFQPVVVALRPVVDAMSAEEVTTLVGGSAAFLGAVYPQLGPAPAGTPASESRELLGRALRAVLASAVETGPVLCVIDDVQWAPRLTLEFLRDVRRDTKGGLMIMATLRVGDAGDARIDAALGVDEDATVLDVAPLDLSDTAALIGLHNRDLAHQPRVIERIHESAAGNPFFVEELALHAGTGPSGALPQSLREVITRRVSLLGSEALDLLTVAAVLGGPFDASALSQVTSEPEPAVAHVLDRAHAASILVRRGHGFDFKHALARDALYGSVTSARRRLMHARIADVLITPTDLVAFHIAAGATIDTLDRVAPAALAAVDDAGPRWASDTRPVLRRALEALGLDPRPRHDRAELLFALAELEYEAGDTESTWRTAEQAALEARAVGDVQLFAAAVKDMGYTMGNTAPFERFVALAEEALAAGGDDDVVVAHAANVLAWFLSWRGNDIDIAAKLNDRGLQAAARLDDPELVAQALSIRADVISGGPDIDLRLRTTEQYMAAMNRAGHTRVFSGFVHRAGALLSAGRRYDFDAACDVAARIAVERPWWLTTEQSALLSACRTLLDGQLSQTLAAISPWLSRFADEGISPFVTQFALVWRENDMTADLVPLIEAIPSSESTSRIVPLLLLLAHAELGRRNEAERELDAVAADDFAQLYGTYARGVALSMAAEAVWHLGDEARARELVRHLRPYGGQVIVVPPMAAAFGPADLYLGLLAETYGDHEAAVARHHAAVALARRVRAPLFEGHASVALARVLREDDPARASELIRGARAIAERLDAARLAASCERVSTYAD